MRSPSACASWRIRRRNSTASDGVRERPRRSFARRRSKEWGRGERSGVAKVLSAYFVRTSSIWPPRSAKAVARIARQPLTASRSVPVTSRNRFLVSDVSCVRIPLITGGKLRTLPAESVMIGNSGLGSTRWANSRPFSCFARISERSISCASPSGVKRTSRGRTALYVNGGETRSRVWIPMATFRPRAHVGDAVNALVEAQTLPEQVDEILVSDVDVGQGRADIVSLFI